ncbi:MAG: hypothetical protein ACTSU5_05530 [Promethearchaeota archaeon]
MIHSVYIIHQLSGVCVIYRKYGSIEFNEDLIAGFLTALKDFSAEVTAGKGQIKVLDMQVYNIMLVFTQGVLVAAAADKQDDRSIGLNALQKVLDAFISEYKGIIQTWSGDLKVFHAFHSRVDEILQQGTIAIVPRELPILKIFHKDYQKAEKLKMKGQVDKGEKLIEKARQKRLPIQVVDQGYLDKEEYEIAHNCDGYQDRSEIAEKAGISEDKLQGILDKLSDLGMIQIVQVEQKK